MKSSTIHFCEKMKIEKIEKSTYLIPMHHLNGGITIFQIGWCQVINNFIELEESSIPPSVS